MRAAYGLAVSTNQVACACSNGIVRMFANKSLAFKVTLPRLVSRGQELGVGSSADAASLSGDMFPDAVGCCFSASEEHLVVVYADRSLTVWSIADCSKVIGVHAQPLKPAAALQVTVAS